MPTYKEDSKNSQLYHALVSYLNVLKGGSVSIHDSTDLGVELGNRHTDLSMSSGLMDIDISEASERWRCFTKMVIDESVLIEQTVQAFQKYEQVAEVHLFLQKTTVEFFVLLNNQEYDDKLMQRLFGIEKIIKKMWDGKYVDIHYAPLQFIDRTTVSHYQLIFTRG